MGIIALNASEESIQAKADIAYQQEIKAIKALIRELETNIKAKNMEINAVKKDIKNFKKTQKEIQKESFINQAKYSEYKELKEIINQLKNKKLTAEREKEALIKELDTYTKNEIKELQNETQAKIWEISNKAEIETYRQKIKAIKAKIIYLKEQIKAFNALIDLKREIDKQ